MAVRSLLMPTKSGDDAIAIPLMLDLEHDALVGLVRSFARLRHDTVQTGAFEAARTNPRQCRDLRVAGVMWIGGCADSSIDSRLRRRSRNGCIHRSRDRLRRAYRRKQKKPAFAWIEASRAMQPDEGAVAKHRNRALHRVAITISPSSTQRCGSCDSSGSIKSGKYRFNGFSSRL